ncbi:InlB B-repeat-containing protein, partial [Methylosoma difficile]
AKAVSANFIPKVSLDISKTGNGNVTGLGISCGALCSGSYKVGTLVKLTAKPVIGSKFTGWGGACSGTFASCTVMMDVAKSVTAAFNP